MYKKCTHNHVLQESGFCYDPRSREPQEILNDCMFREGLTLTVSTVWVFPVFISLIPSISLLFNVLWWAWGLCWTLGTMPLCNLQQSLVEIHHVYSNLTICGPEISGCNKEVGAYRWELKLELAGCKVTALYRVTTILLLPPRELNLISLGLVISCFNWWCGVTRVTSIGFVLTNVQVRTILRKSNLGWSFVYPMKVLTRHFFVTYQGEQTYTPRLISLDLPGSLKTLRREGLLYDSHTEAKDVPAWWAFFS